MQLLPSALFLVKRLACNIRMKSETLCSRNSVCLMQRIWRFRMAIGIVLALALCALSVCGAVSSPRMTRFGTYVSRLCEAVGPFERDAQKFGRTLVTYHPGTKSHRPVRVIVNTLAAIISDSRHVVTTLEAVGSPDIGDGKVLAAGMVTIFDQIAQSDEALRSELHAGIWAWPAASRAKREHLRTSLEALLLVGRQFERLPHTPERQAVMVRSPVCRYLFGPTRASDKEEGRSDPVNGIA